jgi:prolyl-tRNA synthetase
MYLHTYLLLIYNQSIYVGRCGTDPYKDVAQNENILRVVAELVTSLKQAKVRVSADTSRDKTPAWKYAHHEQRGVPIRLEVGGKDLDKGGLVL